MKPIQVHQIFFKFVSPTLKYSRVAFSKKSSHLNNLNKINFFRGSIPSCPQARWCLQWQMSILFSQRSRFLDFWARFFSLPVLFPHLVFNSSFSFIIVRLHRPSTLSSKKKSHIDVCHPFSLFSKVMNNLVAANIPLLISFNFDCSLWCVFKYGYFGGHLIIMPLPMLSLHSYRV